MFDLHTTIEALTAPGKGILAADESNSTIGKRFETIGLENTEENRRRYRELLCSAPIEQYTSGVILFEETLRQKSSTGILLPEMLSNRGIIPGIKVDKGLTLLAHTDDEQVTQGLDGLYERLTEYKKLGARFAKWRNVYKISDKTPSMTAIKSGAERLACYAAMCQHEDIVPIVEPEVLMDGDHPIEVCAEISEVVLHELFDALFRHQVELPLIVLKPSMVIPGKDCPDQCTPEEIADFTLSVFRNNVPAAVPTINFLSGGQTPAEATVNLQAINNTEDAQPWKLSFSFGRALQEPCLKAWAGQDANVAKAQEALMKRLKLNSLASLGEYESALEN